jgi:nucleoside-diphosphate-sugar epimerase
VSLPGDQASEVRTNAGARRVVVTGASSGIGRALAEALLTAGDHVVGVGRASGRLPRGAEPWVADLATGTGVSPSLFTQVDAVYHCAGEITRDDLMRPLHVEGTKHLLAALRTANVAPPRWVQLSSVGAYGPPEDRDRLRTVDERSPERPQGEYEVTKTLADDLVRAAAADGLVSLAVVRPTAVIGRTLPSRSLRQLIALVRRGWYVHVGPPTAIANYVHLDDVVDALRISATHPNAAGQTFNIASDCTWASLISEIASLCGVAVPRRRVPTRPARVLAGLAERFGAPVTRARLDALSSHTVYPSDKIRVDVGLEIQHPMPAAVKDVMEPYAIG